MMVASFRFPSAVMLLALFAAVMLSVSEARLLLKRQLIPSDDYQQQRGEVERCDHHVVVYQGSDSTALRDNYHQAHQQAVTGNHQHPQVVTSSQHHQNGGGDHHTTAQHSNHPHSSSVLPSVIVHHGHHEIIPHVPEEIVVTGSHHQQHGIDIELN